MTPPAHGVPDRVAERVLSRVVADGDCLLSTYSTNPKGYARVQWKVDGTKVDAFAHRVAWIAKQGPIPDGMTVHHKCFRRRCVNVAHLELMEHFENGRRINGEDWPIGTCRNGHPNSMLTYVPSEGKRRCIECWRARMRRQTERRKANRANARALSLASRRVGPGAA